VGNKPGRGSGETLPRSMGFGNTPLGLKMIFHPSVMDYECYLKFYKAFPQKGRNLDGGPFDLTMYSSAWAERMDSLHRKARPFKRSILKQSFMTYELKGSLSSHQVPIAGLSPAIPKA